MQHDLCFSDRQAFRNWLAENADDSPGVWILFGKKGGPSTMKAAEALEEALCFGWIDGVMKSIDDTCYIKYFARRVDNSPWSVKNKGIIEKLEASEAMTDRGRAAIERAKRNGQWDKDNRIVVDEAAIAAFTDLLAPHQIAHKNFLAMSPSIQKTYTGFYLDAKAEATRVRRLEKIVDRLNKNLKPM